MSTDKYRCEAVVGMDDSRPGIVLLKCGKPAKLRGWAALCDKCWEGIKAKKNV